MLRVAVAFVVLAGADFFYQWWDYERQMRMSKQEIKEEYKQTEGDPQVKGKIKQIQRQRAQQRMMQQVPQADVVIRNPTHFAVALRYKPDLDNAPVVLAKGVDELALRIVKVAEEHQIATVETCLWHMPLRQYRPEPGDSPGALRRGGRGSGLRAEAGPGGPISWKTRPVPGVVITFQERMTPCGVFFKTA